MGNASSAGGRERQKSGDFHPPPSPSSKDDGNQIFIYSDKKRDGSLVYQSSNDDEEPNFTKDIRRSEDDPLGAARQRSATITEGTEVTEQVFPTVFKWDGGGKQVLISGTFSDWKTIPMVKSHGDFVTIIDLPEGEHQFKYCVDGEWMHDPSHKVVETDTGTKSNLIAVKNQDFEVFQALAADSETTAANHAPIGDYCQTIPTNNPWEKTSGPPILPPHLLQVILNKDTPISCEPTLLPEPNHVMLNHMYALSIKDGVMVLSATHRYKKKYVTTLLYKPI
uniref:5'-AMP-activated protein kinase subunit beta-1 n=1 Tax=Lygus hesperus TaxID=30085 RepID=A0A0A9YJN3_LYGHE